MDGILSYLRDALANHQASAVSLCQAFGQANDSQIADFWDGLVAEAESKAIALADHEIVKLADEVQFPLPKSDFTLNARQLPLKFYNIQPEASGGV